MTNLQEQEKLIETDNGRFVLELEKVSGALEEYIEAAKVGIKTKESCRTVIEELKEEADKIKNNPDDADKQNTPYKLSIMAVGKLLNILEIKDAEQHELYKALRDAMNVARDSAIGL